MSRTSNLSKITGIAKITWKLDTVTPLCIKSGTTSVWKQATSGNHNVSKLRQVDAAFDFFKKTETEGTISDFYYDAFIKDGDELKIRYRIPPSSVRGALRNYTIKRLVPKEYWNAGLTLALDEDAPEEMQEQERKEYNQKLNEALRNPGWHLIQNLFGLAMDSSDESLEDESVAGRLQIMVDELEEYADSDFREIVISDGFSPELFKPGSTHGRMIFTTRNPIDRITHAARGGGLHSFMELAPGNSFSVTLQIVNPRPADLGFVAFWEQAIDHGLLRLGGLTSVGRGRLNVRSTDIRLFLRSKDGFEGLETGNSFDSDILAEAFPEYTILEWENYRQTYIEKISELYVANGKEAQNG